jgi:hypothetical protein
MKPVNVNAFDVIGDFAAAARIPFGCAVRRSSAGKVDIAYDGAAYDAILGIADWDMVEKTVDGFYSQYDPVPIISAGRVRVWVLGSATGILEGTFLRSADLGSSACGIFDAESTPATRTTHSLAKVLEDTTDLLDANFGGLTPAGATGSSITMASAAVVSAMGLSEGDYIAIGDVTHNQAEINRVKSTSGAVITTQEPLAQTYTYPANCLVDKLVQLEVLLL